MRYLRLLTIPLLATLLACTSCNDEKSTGFNLFTPEQDIEFGEQLDEQIRNTPDSFPVVSREQAPEVYAYLEGMVADIKQSGKLRYKDKFVWKITLIKDETTNAFAAPGGYLYFYTGIIKYLDNGAQLAGVIAHEMAHADRRHSTNQMTKQYGLSTLISLLTGATNSQWIGLAGQLAGTLGGLAFSRSDETEADKYAVDYLSSTKYNGAEMAKFFQKLMDESKGGKMPVFLSTHPSDADRIKAINAEYEKLGSPNKDGLFETEHSAIKAKLP